MTMMACRARDNAFFALGLGISVNNFDGQMRYCQNNTVILLLLMFTNYLVFEMFVNLDACDLTARMRQRVYKYN